MEQVKITQLHIPFHQRIIIVSDLHADYDGFIQLLSKTQFTKDDLLIIVGNVIEKGKHSLKLLQTIIDLKKSHQIHMVMGNNEHFILELIYSNDDEMMQRILSYKTHSLLIDMANVLNLSYQTIDEIKILKQEIIKHFKQELNFLTQLPHIIKTNQAIFVHAGLLPQDLNHQDLEYCLTAPAFSTTSYHFDHPIIVGHWPVTNYFDTILNNNVYFNEVNNVISLDGGNSMKSWQQINYLILKDRQFHTGYIDSLLKIRALDSQQESLHPISLSFPHTKIEIIKAEESLVEAYCPHLNQTLTFKSEQVYFYKNQTYCSDFTTYHLKVSQNDVLSFCEKLEDGILCKHHGIIGIYKGSYEVINQSSRKE